MQSATGYPCGAHTIAFNKLDGSNLRWMWTDKKGWCRQGTRVRLFDHTDDIFAPAIELFQSTLADDLEARITRMKAKSFTVFTEYWGKNSFAGTHQEGDQMFINVIDAAGSNDQMLDVYTFMEHFADHAPRVVYEGKLDDDFIERVRANEFCTEEGVICKGVVKKRPYMFKVKTNEYREKLIGIYGQDWMKFWE